VTALTDQIIRVRIARDGVLPEADSRAELDLARRISDALAARIGPRTDA